MKFTKINLREFAGFGLVGAANTVVTYGLYAVLLFLFSYKVSYSLAYVSGILISYYMNSRLVFHEPVSLLKFIKYPIVYVVQYILGIVVLYVAIDVLGFSQWLAPLLVIAISLPVTFVLSRLIIKGRVWARG
ncbi:MAG: GtrA family protein [Syntrophomonadaceae bacterium]|nr:GtrA family protein [Syntrophomonadaceae bacterium]